MKITIKTFAKVKEKCGFDEKELTVSEGITVGQLVSELKKGCKALREFNGGLLFAKNEAYCMDDEILSDNDILAIFPPVSGG